MPNNLSTPTKVILTITTGKLKGKQFTFDSRTICIIGRARNCNIQIPNDRYHSTVSRYHCLLDINPPDIRIRDFGSRNGTDVNGKCIGKRAKNQTPSEGAKLNFSEYDLQDKDVIKLGNTVFQVSIEPVIAKTFIIRNKQKLNKLSSAIKNQDNSNSDLLQDYTKIKELGVGGFGEVYLARHNQTGEFVAIKTLLPQVVVKPYMKEMFLREVKNMKILNHPNLVRLKDYGFSDGVFFFVMEYCSCGSVSDLINLKKGKLTLEEAIDIIVQVLNSLDYAHTEVGLVHRDIKPDNIFLTIDRGKLIAKLGDYGLSKNFDLAGLSGQTMSGTAMGTPSFMSRKQVLNFKYARPDIDVWAVAASLYFMLTLKYPRDLEGIESMLAILKTQPIPIRERDNSISQTLADLIDLALKDDSELHFQSALDFKQALLQVMQNVTHTTLNVVKLESTNN
jgi:eukaryotic-like serine/threonine-protein kinase